MPEVRQVFGGVPEPRVHQRCRQRLRVIHKVLPTLIIFCLKGVQLGSVDAGPIAEHLDDLGPVLLEGVLLLDHHHLHLEGNQTRNCELRHDEDSYVGQMYMRSLLCAGRKHGMSFQLQCCVEQQIQGQG